MSDIAAFLICQLVRRLSIPESSKGVTGLVTQGPTPVEVVDYVEGKAGQAVQQAREGQVQDEQGHVPVNVKRKSEKIIVW